MDKMTIAQTVESGTSHDTKYMSEGQQPLTQNQKLKTELLNHLSKSNAIFKSQQKGEPDLTTEEKLEIAKDLLKKNHCLFLSKFGCFLKQEHLKYFDEIKETDYEVAYHIARLQRYFNNATRQKDIKNRRYEALKILIAKGEYFSDAEMMKRNPLLYEHLVGRYLTEKQIMERDNIDNPNVSYVDFLMESIDKEVVREKQKLQEEEESNVMEENDSDDSDNDGSEVCSVSESLCDMEDTEAMTENFVQKDVRKNISTKEKELLREEFISNMYQSFLNGKDIDFDYSIVDNNEAYDNIDLRTQDEEEKYFDSESPEEMNKPNRDEQQSLESTKADDKEQKLSENESEDELDIYMKSLKENITTSTISLDNET